MIIEVKPKQTQKSSLQRIATYMQLIQMREDGSMKDITLNEIKSILGEKDFEDAEKYLAAHPGENLSAYIESLPLSKVRKLLKITEDNPQTEKRTYRTKGRTETTELPQNLAVITNSGYQNGLSLYQHGGAYLQPLASTDGLRFDSGTVYFKGFPASEATLKQINQDKEEVAIDSIDLPLLRTFYSIILAEFERKFASGKPVSESVSIYVPDLAVYLGKSRNIGKNDIQTITDKVSSFQTIFGVLKDPARPKGIGTIVPLLVFLGYFEKDNTIRFSSPYMNLLIQRIYNVSIRKDRKGGARIKSDGTPQMLPSHSYLIKSSIAKERNKKAVEIVTIVVTTIEQAGPAGVPHIKARTIVERNTLLSETLSKCVRDSNRNTILKRAFTKAWELLETQTDLRKKYPDIALPDPNNPMMIPTMATLDTVYTFTHTQPAL